MHVFSTEKGLCCVVLRTARGVDAISPLRGRRSKPQSVMGRSIMCSSMSPTPCTLAEPLSAPKNHRSHTLLLYVWIHLSYLGQSCAKVTAHNSKYSQSYNHAKFLILHVRWQSRCQHPKTIDQISSCYMSGFTYHTQGNHLLKLQLINRNIHRVTTMQSF